MSGEHPHDTTKTEFNTFCSLGLCRQRLKTLELRSGAHTAIGPVRATNDDLVFAGEHCRLFVVLDGVGGHDGGAEASRIVLDALRSRIESMCRVSDQDAEQQLETALNDALTTACETMRSLSEQDASLEKMGTVFALAYVVGDTLLFSHVGDCRVYLNHNGRLKQLTHDETFVQLMLDAGMIKPNEVPSHPMRSVILNGVGPKELEKKPFVETVPLKTGDTILLTSDGVTDFVQPKQLAQLLADNSDPQLAAKRIVDAAIDASGKDNASCVVVRVSAATSEIDGDSTTHDNLRSELGLLNDSLVHVDDDLTRLTSDIQSALDDRNSHELNALGKHFKDSVLRFETHHPHLTGILGNIADLLSGMGI